MNVREETIAKINQRSSYPLRERSAIPFKVYTGERRV